jgi:phosphatidylglycerophosphatase A
MQYYNPHFLICTFFGIGKFFKKCPGTIGSFLAIPISYLISSISPKLVNLFFSSLANNYIALYIAPIIFLFSLFAIGSYSSEKYSEEIDKKDSKEIIIDEVVAQSLCFFVTIPLTFVLIYTNIHGKVIYYDVVLLASISANIALFRFFDIIKPWPIKLAESKLQNGFGVMFDDILAAIFSVIVYLAALLIFIDFYAK